MSMVSQSRLKDDETRQQFDRLVRNEELLGEYAVAARHLVAGEQPFAWLNVSLRGVSVPHVLITDKRILVFSAGLRAQSLCFVFGFALEEVAGVSNQWAMSRRTDVRIQLSTRAGPQELVLRRLPMKTAQEVEQFLNSRRPMGGRC